MRDRGATAVGETATDRACSSAVGLTLEDLQAAIRACSPAAYLIVSEYVTAGQTFRLQAAPADLPFVGRGQRDAGIRWVVSADDLAELEAKTGATGDWLADVLERAHLAGVGLEPLKPRKPDTFAELVDRHLAGVDVTRKGDTDAGIA